ncbi:MAG: outer membrane beta-barrel protein [Acidobacteria bacterium]|nr:outer membrane beta-barrel protein [Acidobacteriota bacterium]
MLRNILLVPLVLIICLDAGAQKNDFGLTLGGYLAASNPLNIGAAWAIEATYARRFLSLPVVSISGELPWATSFQSSIPTFNGTTLARSYTSLFITPGLRLRLAPSFLVSPYVSAGLGYGRFNRQLLNGTTSPEGTFALDVAGGLDLKVLPFVSLRGELRDFNSSTFGFQSLISGGRQNNVFLTFGLGVRF